ncbi:PAS domain-containing protein [Magnetospira thiophila]
MTETVSAPSRSGGTRAGVFVVGALGLLAVLMVVGLFAVNRFIDQERQRDIQAWQVRLGLIADSRAAAVQKWLDSHFDLMRGLAENASLQLYMTEMTGTTNAQPEAEYLQSLLLVTAQQGGFLAETPGLAVRANVARTGQAGIALTDAEGIYLAATQDMPPMTPRLRAAMDEAAQGHPVLIDIYQAPAGPSLGFVVPVYGIQEEAASANNLGFVVGIKRLGSDLYDALVQPGDASTSSETLLVRRNGNLIDYLSALSDGTPPLKRQLAADTPDLAAAFVLREPGGFGEYRDYAQTPVLVTGRAISGTPWVVLRKIASSEALSATDSRLQTMLVVFVLLIVGLGVAVIAVWRHGTSVRTARALEEMSVALERFQNFSKFLTVVTDGHPAMIAAVSGETKYTFANRWLAETAGISKEDVLGKTMASVIGPMKARQLEPINDHVLKHFEPLTKTLTFEEEGGQRRIYHGYFLPLRGDRDYPPAVLQILQDITEVVDEREKREHTMRRLVTTLVTLVDRRDPYSAHQSARVAEVARLIAEEMGESDDMVRTVDLAGNLMNLGKVLVPPELLTKTGRLSDDEVLKIRESMLSSADLLDGLDFDVPVGTVVRDLQEKWDGSGYPAGKQGVEIHPGARIIAVANAFVGMVSPRAYREAIPLDRAVTILREGVAVAYDRRPVSALGNVLDNRGGREALAHYMERPTDIPEEA